MIAVALWARIMSRPNDWTIRSTELAKSCNLNVGTIKKYIRELIEAGYAHRQKITDPKTGRFVSWEVVVFETKKDKEEIQKMFPETAFPSVETPSVVNPPITNIESTDNHKTDISYVGSEPPTSEIPLSKENQEDKKTLPIDAWDAANNLWSHIYKLFPKHKPPKMDQWAKHFDIMNRRDNRSWEDIRKVIDFAFEDNFWVGVIDGPGSLRKNFDKMLAKMTPVDNSGTRIVENTETARNAKKALAQGNDQNKLTIYKASVVNETTGESISLNLPPETFTTIIAKWFGLEVKNG
jgi:DNA-binding MarR family transcriptional regulator